MQMLLFVVLGLCCFLFYDFWTVHSALARWPQGLFAAGLVCDALVTAWMLCRSVLSVSGYWPRAVLFWAVSLVWLALLTYTLFFALPFDQTYADPTKKRCVCRTGMYALCRHPGVMWFILFYAFLYLAVPIPETLWGGAALCVGNIIYILIQDFWTFPRTFIDYDTYRQEVPFLIPTWTSVRRAQKTWPKRGLPS